MSRKLFKVQFGFFFILIIFWNVFTPVLEGADEVAHFCSIDYIAHQNKIPDLRSPGCFIWHPPLYYLILSPLVKAFNRSEFSEQDIKTNPRFSFLRKGEYSQFVHDQNELFFKWNSFQAMIHVIRFISSIFGVGIFILAWKLSAKVFKNKLQRNLSLLIFFNPMFLHIFTTISNVALVSLIASLFIAIDLIYANKDKSFKIYFLQGVLLGLGYIAKISILGLLFAWAFLFYIHPGKSKKNLILRLTDLIVTLIGFLGVTGWYLVRNIRLYGEVLEINVLVKNFGLSHHDLLLEKVGLLNYLNSFFLTLFRTFWSGYGALTVSFPEIVNLALLIVTLFIAYAIIAKFKRMNMKLKICLYYFLSMLFGILVINLRLASMHAKDNFPVFIPIAFLSSYGIFHVGNAIKSLYPKYLIHFCFLSLIIYFFAQYEIVRLLKFVLQILGVEIFYIKESVDLRQISIILVSKLTIAIIIYLVINLLIRRLIITKNFIYLATIAIFGLNLIVLAFSTYLFYFKFLL